MVSSPPSLSVAIPDSSLIDSKTLLEKSLRVAQFARAFSIFRVKQVYLYHDISYNAKHDDVKLITTLLEYLNTPQYLRRVLYPKMKQLQYVGMLPPIKSPHHKKFLKTSHVRAGETRMGVLLRHKGSWVVDVGLDHAIPFLGSNQESRKSNFRLSMSEGKLVAEEIKDANLGPGYWGYNIIQLYSLSELAKRSTTVKFVITSRNGRSISIIRKSLIESLSNTAELVIVFGSPRKGVLETVSKNDVMKFSSPLIINMFPLQGTDTVRLEEAIMGSLAIINSICVSLGDKIAHDFRNFN
jgi:predicted SPOUT superfamily RNA methylase MTH1